MLIRFVSTLVMAGSCFGCMDGEPEVEKNFELGRFQGRWHEIARIPRDYDKECHGTVADYLLVAGDRLDLTHTCSIGSATGPKRQFRATATVDDADVPAKMSLQIGLYVGSYWVLDVGDNYEYAVVGHPSRTMLWILARAPALDAATYDAELALARKQGYGTDMLRKTPE